MIDPFRSTLSRGLLSRKAWGSGAAEWIVGLAILAGPLLALWYGLQSYPLLETWAWTFMVVGLFVGAVALPVVAHRRYHLMPWGSQQRLLMWHVVVGLSVQVSLLVVAALLIANGAFDRSIEHVLPFSVISRSCGRSECHLRVRSIDAEGSKGRSGVIFVPPLALDQFRRGDTVDVTLKQGALGHAWVLGYHQRPRNPGRR